MFPQNKFKHSELSCNRLSMTIRIVAGKNWHHRIISIS